MSIDMNANAGVPGPREPLAVPRMPGTKWTGTLAAQASSVTPPKVYRRLRAHVRQTAQSVADQLGMQEVRRRLWHMSPGLLPFVFWILPHADPVSWFWRANFIFDGVVLNIAVLKWCHSIRRREDEKCICSALGFTCTVLPLLVLFPAVPEIGFSVLTILAFGDGSATLAGLLKGKARLPWNPEKTWVGSLAFLAAATPISTLAYWLLAIPAVPLRDALICCAFATLMSAIVESLPSRINDNIRVGVIASLAIAAAHCWLG